MAMKVLLAVLVAAFCGACMAQDDIQTGEGLFSLFFPGGGAVELQSGNMDERTLSSVLPRSFSFEAWIMSPDPADGFYKAITARWDQGPDGFHNKWSDWNLQVQTQGQLNFFMGNGEINFYGILMSPLRIVENTWYHVAFSVETPEDALNPTKVSLIVNGVEVSSQGWGLGQRQERRNRPIYIGDYFNQDGDHKWWRGYVDEVRFWGVPRSAAEVAQGMQRVVPYDSANLLSYHRFNEGSGLTVADSSVPRYDGRLATGSGTPQWKVSGVKIQVDRHVASEEVVTLTLPGLSPAGALSFNYIIKTLPSSGSLLSNGERITQVPFTLPSNQVTFVAPASRGVPTSFSYYGSPPEEEEETFVFIQVGEAPCIVDACGRCGGDNSTCTCLPLPYNGYSLADIERILLLYEIEQSLDLLNQLEGKLEKTMKTLATSQASDLQVIIDEVQNFNSQCLIQFCQKVDRYMDQLAAIAP